MPVSYIHLHPRYKNSSSLHTLPGIPRGRIRKTPELSNEKIICQKLIGNISFFLRIRVFLYNKT